MDLRSEPSPNAILGQMGIWIQVRIFRTQGPDFSDLGQSQVRIRFSARNIFGPRSGFYGPRVHIFGPRSEPGPNQVSHQKQIRTQVRILRTQGPYFSDPGQSQVRIRFSIREEFGPRVHILRTLGPSPYLQGLYFPDPGPNSPKVRIPLGSRGTEGAAPENSSEAAGIRT